MLSRGDAATRVRPKYSGGSRRNGACNARRQPQSVSPNFSASPTSSDALFSVGPYTYVVRQPLRKNLPGEGGRTAAGNREFQSQLGVGLHSADERKWTQETNPDEETPLWISPVVPQRQGDEDALLEEASWTPKTPAFSPPPQPPSPACVNENRSCINGPSKQERGRGPTPSQTPQQRCGNTSAPTPKLLMELLGRIQKHREAGALSSFLPARRKASPGEKETWNSPRPQQRRDDDEQKQQKQQISRGVFAVSRLYGDIEEQRSTSKRRAARHRRNEALRFIGIDAGREQGVFTESDLSPLANSSAGPRASLNTSEWGDQLWCGIKEDEERLRRWMMERGLLPSGDAAVLRVFTDYLKKKADRLERDYDELFWATRWHPAPRQEEKEWCHRADYPPRRVETSTEQLRGMTLGVEQPLHGHPYSIDTKTGVGSVPRSARAPTNALMNGRLRWGPVWDGCEELNRDTPTTSTLCCRGDAERNTTFSCPLGSPRGPTKKLRSHGAYCDTSLFYTGHSIAAGADKKWKSHDGRRSSSPPLSSCSAHGEQATSRPGHHCVTERGTSPLSPREENHRKKDDFEGKEEIVPRPMEKNLDSVTGEGAVYAAAPTASPISRPPGESRLPAASPKSTLTFPSLAGLEDASAVIRLRNYCGQLDRELMQILGVRGARRECTDAEGDVVAAVGGIRKRESTDPAHCTDKTSTVGTGNRRRRPVVLSPPPPSPPPPSSLPAASSLIARHHEVTENGSDDNTLTQLNVSSVSFPSHGERGLPRAAYFGELRKEFDAAREVNHKTFPTTRIDVSTEHMTPMVTVTPSVLGQDDGRRSDGDQGTFSASISFVSSRHISPMPHEPRTTTPHSVIREMERRRSLAASRVASVNQSTNYTPPRLAVHGENLSDRVVGGRDANAPHTPLECPCDRAITGFSPRLKGDVPGVVPTSNTALDCGHLLEPAVAPVQPNRSLPLPWTLKTYLASAEDVGEIAEAEELLMPSTAHETTGASESSKANSTQEIPELVSRPPPPSLSRGDLETASIRSSHNMTKRPGSTRINRGPGSVAWSSSSSSGSSSRSSSGSGSGSGKKNFIDVDVKKEGTASRAPVEGRRFGHLLLGGSSSSAATPIAMPRPSLGVKNGVDSNRVEEKTRPSRGLARDGGQSSSVAEGAGIRHCAPRKNANPFFVGVVNNGKGEGNRPNTGERCEGRTGASRSRRFGLSMSIR